MALRGFLTLDPVAVASFRKTWTNVIDDDHNDDGDDDNVFMPSLCLFSVFHSPDTVPQPADDQRPHQPLPYSQ